MGNLCSCLLTESDNASELLVDENTPLLEDDIYRINNLKSELRQAELDAIVHSTEEQLLDVNAFEQQQQRFPPQGQTDMIYSPNGGVAATTSDMMSDSMTSVQSTNNHANNTFNSEIQQQFQTGDMPSLSNYTTTQTATVNDLSTMKFQFLETDSIDDESKKLKDKFGDVYDKCIQMDLDGIGDLKLDL